MNDIVLTTREFLLYVIIAGALIGAVLGLVPLLMGRRRGKGRLGVLGFAVSIVTGAIAPLLSLIAVGIFVWLILRGRSDASAAEPADMTAPEKDTPST